MKKIIIVSLLFLITGCSSNTNQNNHYNQVFTVSFLNWDGNVLYEDSVEYGHSATYLGPTPTRPTIGYTSYVFKGWDKDYSYITHDLITMALFDEVQDESNPEYTNCSLNMKKISSGYDIKDIYSCESKTKMILPNYYEGEPVVSIGYGRNANTTDGLLSCGPGITEIKFPTELREIGYGAFYRYKSGPSFESLEFPEKLEKIDSWAFRSINTLKSVKCNSALKNIGEVAFFGCEKINTLILSRELQSIGYEAFRGAFDDNVHISIYIPKSVTSVGEKAFYDTHYERQENGDYIEAPAHITFYCEAESKPSGWNDKWNWYGTYQYYNKPLPAYDTHWGVPFPY